ncbi:flagellar FliJ family protein [Microbacterium sp.]|uniref:flagellar FliJ family protein n=1 Tax=Microbacterium sp. TaxID=51671 RepID=UPI003A8E8C39
MRGIQEREAAQRLSRATIEADQTQARDRRLRAALGGSDGDGLDGRSLAALAATRAAGRAMLADLSAVAATQQRALDAARIAHDDVRREVKGLDKLAQAHAGRVRADQLHREQAELDEIALRARTESDA